MTTTVETPNVPTTVDPAEQQLAEILQAHIDQLEVDQMMANKNAHAIASLPEEDRFAEWFMGELTKIEACKNQITNQYKAMMSQLETREKALHWKWGARIRAVVDAKLAAQKGNKKKKSVDFMNGTAGYRKVQSSVTILDGKALADWCSENLPDALEIKVARTTPIKEWIESRPPNPHTGEKETPPGCHYSDEHDKFYPAVDRRELPRMAPRPVLADGEVK